MARPDSTPIAFAPDLPRPVWMVVALTATTLWLFADRLRELAACWASDPDCSHGFLVIPISLALAFRAFQNQPLRRPELVLGSSCIATGCLLHLVADVVWLPPIDFAALTAILYGSALTIGGRAWARRFWFPIAFLAFMFPLPAVLSESLALHLQEAVTIAAARVLALVLPVYREGCVLHLPGGAVEVGAACSGIRQVIVFVGLGLLLAHLHGGSRLGRALLVLSTPLIAVGVNTLRVLLMAAAVSAGGPEWIQGRWHEAWGLSGMAAGVVLLLAVQTWTARLCPSSETQQPNVSFSSSTNSPRGLALALSLVLLTALAQSALQSHLQADSAAPLPELSGPLAALPQSLGDWRGRDISPETLPSSAVDFYNDADDRLYRSYTISDDSSASSCRLWLIYCRDGRDRLHHPEICHRVAGLRADPTANADLDVPGGPPIKRFCFRDDRGPHYVLYWHYTLEPPDDLETAPLRALHRRLTHRAASLTAEVFIDGATPTDLARAVDFARAVASHLQVALPPSSRRGSGTLPIRLQMASGRGAKL